MYLRFLCVIITLIFFASNLIFCCVLLCAHFVVCFCGFCAVLNIKIFVLYCFSCNMFPVAYVFVYEFWAYNKRCFCTYKHVFMHNLPVRSFTIFRHNICPTVFLRLLSSSASFYLSFRRCSCNAFYISNNFAHYVSVSCMFACTHYNFYILNSLYAQHLSAC